MTRQPSPRVRLNAVLKQLPLEAHCDSAEQLGGLANSIYLVTAGIALRLDDERVTEILALAERPGARMVVRITADEVRVFVGGSLVRHFTVTPMRPARLTEPADEDWADEDDE